MYLAAHHTFYTVTSRIIMGVTMVHVLVQLLSLDWVDMVDVDYAQCLLFSTK